MVGFLFYKSAEWELNLDLSIISLICCLCLMLSSSVYLSVQIVRLCKHVRTLVAQWLVLSCRGQWFWSGQRWPQPSSCGNRCLAPSVAGEGKGGVLLTTLPSSVAVRCVADNITILVQQKKAKPLTCFDILVWLVPCLCVFELMDTLIWCSSQTKPQSQRFL